MLKREWWKLSIEIHKELEEIIIWKLDNLNIQSYAFNYLNKQSLNIELVIWLPKSEWNSKAIDNLEDDFSKFLLHNNFNKSYFFKEFIREEDWFESWKKYWQPELIGDNFLVLPFWIDLPEKHKNKRVIKIDPGAAFGTGSHPSTSLCLETIEKESIVGQRVLDIGSGSGILTIAAKLLGAGELFAIDKDSLAVKSTEENFNLNFGNLDNLEIFQDDFLDLIRREKMGSFDLILCNILADVIKKIIPALYEALDLNGVLILSGILATQKDDVIKVMHFNQLKIENVAFKQDWVCIKASK